VKQVWLQQMLDVQVCITLCQMQTSWQHFPTRAKDLSVSITMPIRHSNYMVSLSMCTLWLLSTVTHWIYYIHVGLLSS